MGSFLGPQLDFSEDILRGATGYIIKNAHGVFLWVHLIKGELLKYSMRGTTKKRIFDFLKGLPMELEGLYERMLGELEGGSEDAIVDGIKMFRFIFFGLQPPTVAELQHALAVPDGPGDDVNEESFQDAMPIGIEKRIVHCGRNLLEIKGREDDGTCSFPVALAPMGLLLTASIEPSVQVMHQTVRGFLLRPDGCAATSRFKANAKDAHTWIATICLRYPILWATNTRPDEFPPIGSWETRHYEEYVRYLECRKLINYALVSTGRHMQEVKDSPGFEKCLALVNMLARKLQPRNPAIYVIGDWVRTTFGSDIREYAEAPQFKNQMIGVAVTIRFSDQNTVLRWCLSALAL